MMFFGPGSQEGPWGRGTHHYEKISCDTIKYIIFYIRKTNQKAGLDWKGEVYPYNRQARYAKRVCRNNRPKYSKKTTAHPDSA